MPPKIIVTGGAGYVGSHICKTLSQNGFVPVIYDNLCSGRKEAALWGPFVNGDIRDRDGLSRTLKHYNPIGIIHCAGLLQIGRSAAHPAEFYDNNVYGSLCVLEAAHAQGVSNIVFSSSAAVYGALTCVPIAESAALSPINPYGRSKAMAEAIIADFTSAYDMRAACLRYFNAAGADPDCETGSAYQTNTHLIPLLMDVAAGRQPHLQIFGNDYDTKDGTAIRDYIHVGDLAAAHVKALRHLIHNRQNVTLNLGTGQGYSVAEVIAAARKITGRDIKTKTAPRRAGDPAVLMADPAAAIKTLKWMPRHSTLDTIIKTAWAWEQSRMAANAATAMEAA
ncbi:MAG: UDP-glucose 4-epimerase GalE [Bdellovibrionales bacterium]